MAVQSNLGVDYELSDTDNDFCYWSEEDEDCLVGDADWEFTAAARAWEARRVLFAEAKILQKLQEAALEDICFLFEPEEDCVTCLPNWDWVTYQSEVQFLNVYKFTGL